MPIYMKYDGVEGDVTESGHEEKIELSAPEAPRSASETTRGRWLPFGLLALILLLLLLCLVLVLGPGRRFLNVVSSGPTATATQLVNKPPTDAPTATMTATPELTETAPPETGDGACNAACDPANSNCLAGLSCLPVPDTSGRYVCWNDAICQPTRPAPTDAPTQQTVQQCGPGWLPAAGCVCCGTTKVCADGTVATFNPACGVGSKACTCIPYPSLCMLAPCPPTYRCKETGALCTP